MATNQQKQQGDNKDAPLQKVKSEVQKVASSSTAKDVEESAIVQKGVGPLRAFFKKFTNDWTMNLQAAALAYSLVVAIFPILIALFLVFGLVLGGMAPDVQQSFTSAVANVLPKGLGAGVVQQLLVRIQKSAGALEIIVLVTAIFGGSRLFILIENCFALIYHQPPRTVIKQNLIAIGMLLIFAILIPVMLLASTAPALLISFLKSTTLNSIPGGQFLFSAIGILSSLLVTWILFEAIYLIMPNQHVSFRDSWRGAVIAAIGLQIYLTLFPFYATHFLSGYGGQAGFAVILIVFFYYFAVILLLGAQVNAFFGEGVQKTPDNLASLVHGKTNRDPKSPEEQHAQATPEHKEDMDSNAQGQREQR
ncbi:MAG TPA: YihY/virulence factor BrkB family protein [Ktedonobacteraceae bacterium]|nr:YihY/virulence factor BrkB family protein [Ktedonobacteraceae bacterium]